MINKFFIANKYAEALIEGACESGNLEAVIDDFKVIHSVIDGDFLKLLKIVDKSKAAAEKVIKFFKEQNFCYITHNFFNLLLEYKRVTLLPEMVEAFFEINSRKENCEKIIIESPVSLENAEKERLKNMLQKYTEKNLCFKFVEDKDLIYGIRVKYKSKVLDFSLQSKLDRF